MPEPKFEGLTIEVEGKETKKFMSWDDLGLEEALGELFTDEQKKAIASMMSDDLSKMFIHFNEVKDEV